MPITDPDPPEPRCVSPGLTPSVYAEWRASEVGQITERLERRLILELIGDVRGQHILDVGCGDGSLAVALAKRGAHVVGIDASQAMIDAARQRARREQVPIEFTVGTVQHLPFQPGRFDIVVAVTILCFVEDAAPAFAEMARVLRPGGRLVIGELGKWSTWSVSRRLRGWLGARLWRQARFRTPRELRSLAAAAGLHPEIVRGAIYYPRLAPAARLLAPFDETLGRLTPVGAAFLALCATKPV